MLSDWSQSCFSWYAFLIFNQGEAEFNLKSQSCLSWHVNRLQSYPLGCGCLSLSPALDGMPLEYQVWLSKIKPRCLGPALTGMPPYFGSQRLRGRHGCLRPALAGKSIEIKVFAKNAITVSLKGQFHLPEQRHGGRRFLNCNFVLNLAVRQRSEK